MFKRFMRSAAVQTLAGFLLAAYMALVKYTTRWEVIGREHAAPLINSGEGFIALTWHSRFLMLTSAWKKNYQQPYVLISQSRDGDIVARTSAFLGIKTVRGSARRANKKGEKGGAKAFREMQKSIAAGGCMVITPDGPKGPRQRLGDGPLTLAKLSGAPLVSCIFSVRRRKVFNSWDRFVLPLPFGKGQIIWGEPVRVEAGISDEAFAALRERIEAEMNANMAQADEAMRHSPVLPEAPRRSKARG